MKRICLIGSSHLACWKLAWDETKAEYADKVSLTFFGASGRGLAEANISGRTLVPHKEKLLKFIKQTSGGRNSVEIDKYTHFVIVGLEFSFSCVCSLFINFGLQRHLPIRPRIRLISSACLDQCLDDSLRKASALLLHKKLKSLTDHPIFIVPNPCVAEDAVKPGWSGFGVSYADFAPVVEMGYMQDIYSIFERRAEKIASENELNLLMQDPHSMAFPGFTKSEYSRGGIGFVKASSSPRDVKHMNKAYGKLCLEQMLRAIAGGSVD